MYTDDDIEMMNLTAAANERAAVARAATREPTDEDLDLIWSVAYEAAYYMSPISEAVTQVCADEGLDPRNEQVESVLFAAAMAAGSNDAAEPGTVRRPR